MCKHIQTLKTRELDDVDPEVVQLTQEVSQFAFPEDKKPTKETIMTGYKVQISSIIVLLNEPNTKTVL